MVPIEDDQTFWRADKSGSHAQIDQWAQQTLERSIAQGLYDYYPTGRFFEWSIVVWNGVVCAALTLGLGFVFEYLVRRRKPQT